MALSRGFSRTLAVLLLVLVGVLVWRGVARPLWAEWLADRELIAEQRASIARLRGLAALRDDYLAALESERGGTDLEGALIRAASDTLGAAELQQQVKALVEGVGGSLVSAQPIASQAAGPYTRIGLNLRMLVTVEALQKVLHALETQRPVIVIDQMLILSRGGNTRLRRRRPATDQLDVRLEVSGFLATSGAGA